MSFTVLQPQDASLIPLPEREPVKTARAFAFVGYRSPLVGCSFQNLSASNALAEDATPARTDRASTAEMMVFMIVLRTRLTIDMAPSAFAKRYLTQQ
jgi:hypothetical protein